MAQRPKTPDFPAASSTSPADRIHVRLIEPGEGASVIAVAAAANAPGADGGSPLQSALDRHGGHIAIPDLPGGTGWCFGAFTDGLLLGVIYACSPVAFLQACSDDRRQHLTGALIEIEIFAVDEACRGAGVGTALLSHAEEHFRRLGVQLTVAKVDATSVAVMRWYRHRGYTIAHPGESCYVNTPSGSEGIDAGRADGQWRLAVKALNGSITRRIAGLQLMQGGKPSNS